MRWLNRTVLGIGLASLFSSEALQPVSQSQANYTPVHPFPTPLVYSDRTRHDSPSGAILPGKHLTATAQSE